MSKSLLLRFTSRGFMVSGLIFKSLIHFEFIFYIWWEKVVQFDYFACYYLVVWTPFAQESVFSHCISLLLFHRLIDHVCVGLFLDSVLFHWSLSVSKPVSHCLEVKKHLLLFLKIVLAIWDFVCVCFHTNFNIIVLVLWKMLLVFW